jgi:peptidoglycan/xylan/chitin deacetylase (PgdA/CDA1 family)
MALKTARVSASIGGNSLSLAVLKRLRISYEPPSQPVRYPHGARAAACVSIDFDVTQSDRAEANHQGTSSLLDLSEEFGVPLTWAVCGMTADADRSAYERILNSSVGQEVGIHTYSHIDALKCDAAEFEEDIRRCLASLGMKGAPSTFVFPWNRENHFDVIRRMGFKCYRGKDRAIGPPRLFHGLWNVRPVYYVDRKSLGAGALMNQYLDLCVETRSAFHLWTHPWGVSIDGHVAPMKKTLEPVFRRMRELSQSGVLDLGTMGQLAEHFDSQARASAHIETAAREPRLVGSSKQS